MLGDGVATVAPVLLALVDAPEDTDDVVTATTLVEPDATMVVEAGLVVETGTEVPFVTVLAEAAVPLVTMPELTLEADETVTAVPELTLEADDATVPETAVLPDRVVTAVV